MDSNNNRLKTNGSVKNGNYRNGNSNGHKRYNNNQKNDDKNNHEQNEPRQPRGEIAYNSKGDMLLRFNPDKVIHKPLPVIAPPTPEAIEELCRMEWVEIEFKGNRRNLFKNPDKLEFEFFDYAVVEAENGYDIGNVVNFGERALKKAKSCYLNKPKNFSVIRKANDEDLRQLDQNRIEDEEVVNKTRELAEKYKLDMKITEAEWQLDKHRLTIFFTAPQRIDFRELVKDLARAFRTRIELRQISTREEARRIGGGIGCCGLNCCCTSFLHDFSHVTLDHARTQQLSNNVAKLSGNCGRLKCCLLFEYDHYVDAFSKYPPHNSFILSDEGEARIIKVDIFKNMITLVNSKDNKYKTITAEELEAHIREGRIYKPVDPYRNGYDALADSEEELRALEDSVE